jgi:hypothetical protein
MMAINGDTVRLTATFKNFADTLVDPTSITVKFYDQSKTQIGTTITEVVKDDVGVYHYDYTIPDGYKKIYYEWTGMIDDKPSVERDIIQVTFV